MTQMTTTMILSAILLCCRAGLHSLCGGNKGRSPAVYLMALHQQTGEDAHHHGYMQPYACQLMMVLDPLYMSRIFQ